MLKSKIRAVKTVVDVIGLIPDIRVCKNPETITAFYDKVKEMTMQTTDETDLGILKTNFIDHPIIDFRENKSLAIFILHQFIITAKSYTRLEMITKDIEDCEDPNLSSYFEEAKASFASYEQN